MNKNNQKKTVKTPVVKQPVKKAGAVQVQNGVINLFGIKIPENRLVVVITAAVLALVLLASTVIFTVDYIVNDKGFDYLKSNLSKYVSISENDYKSFTLEVDVAKPREVDLHSSILSLITANKGDAIEGPGQMVNSGVSITPGSIVKLWYRGYILDNDGNEVVVDGLTNYDQSGAAELEIGSLYFPAGFELGLIDYYLDRNRTRFEKLTDGVMTSDMVVYVNYTKTLTSSGTKTESKNIRLDLSEDIDAEYGQGFKDHILSMSIGADKEFGITDPKGVHYTYKLTVNFATECENADDVLVLDSYFSYNTSNDVLKNQDVKFEVFVESVRRFEYDEFNDEFVQKIIDKKESKATLEIVNSYEGETLTDRFVEYLKDELDKTYTKLYNQAVEEALWNYLHEKATVKRYPKSKVDSIYTDYLSDLEREYEFNGGQLWSSSQNKYVTYNTLDAYAVAYYGFVKSDEYATWRDYLYGVSESFVGERLIFYYIMDKVGFAPSSAEIEQGIEDKKQEYITEYIEQYLQSEGKTEKHFTEEEYAAYVAERTKEVLDYYDDAHFEEMAYYKLFLDEILTWCEISTLDDRSYLPEIM